MRAASHAREWSGAVDAPSAWAQAYVFRRSRQIARELSAELCGPGERWADAGCGTGWLTAQLASDAGVVIGIDCDIAMLRAARHQVARPLPNLCCARAEQLPLPDASMHGIVAVSLLGCLEDPLQFLREVRRLLRPGGWAILTFTNRESWLLRLNYQLPRRWISADGSRGYRTFTAKAVTYDLEDLGLSVQRVLFYNHVLHVWRWLIPPRCIAPALDRFGRHRASRKVARNFVVIARKDG